MERTLTEELKRCCPDEKTGARLDIAYRTSGGRHVIVELKRPGEKSLDFFKLLKQGEKYVKAMEQYLREHPDMLGLGGRVPPIDLFFVLEYDAAAKDERRRQMLRDINAQVFTYKGLIESAERAYEEYLSVHDTSSRIDKIIRNL